MQKMGYWVDLADYKFDDTTSSTWIHAMPIGHYSHPVYGDIEVTSERVKNFADGVTKKIRGQDLDIDYDHKVKTDEAAGWVKQAEARTDGLWLLVDWTQTALRKLQEKAYRYFSPEFQDEWTHPATKQTFKDVLFGGGLTNRPYMKGILPINMSELDAVPTKFDEGSKGMTPEQIKKFAVKFGLGDDATEDQVVSAIESAELASKAPSDDTAVALSELEKELAAVKKLAESNTAMAPVVKLMEAQAVQMKTMQDAMDKTATALRLSEINATVLQFSEKASEKGYAIPKPVIEKATKFFSEHGTSKKLSDDFASVVTDLLDAKLVQLGEVTRRRGLHAVDVDDDPRKKFSEGVNKLVTDEKLSYTDAVHKFADLEPELYKDYRLAVGEGA